MSRWGTKPDTRYLKCPLRKIVKRFVVVDFDWPYYPSYMLELECGHTEYNRGQKKQVRCYQCEPKSGV